MEVEIFCLADYASLDSVGKLNISGIFDSFTDRNFPTKHDKCYAVAKVRLESKESGIHMFRLSFIDDRGDALAFAQGSLEKIVPSNQTGSITIIAKMENLPLPYPAIFSVQLEINNMTVSRFPVTILKEE